MATLVNQEYQYQSGTGSDAWTYKVLIDSHGNYKIRVTSTPLGVSTRDLLDMPASVVEDMYYTIERLRSFENSSAVTGITGVTG